MSGVGDLNRGDVAAAFDPPRAMDLEQLRVQRPAGVSEELGPTVEPVQLQVACRQVWNRQRIDHNETEPGDKRTSRGAVRRWNPRDQWVISTRVVHPPLVSEADFVTTQTVSAVPTPQDGRQRRYQLTGLVICRVCGRRVEAHWVHGRPGYRCRHGRTSASPPMPGRPKPFYLREDVIIAAVLRHFGHTTGGDLDPAAAAVYLRTNRLMVICDRTTITVTGEPTTGCPQQRPPPEPPET